METKKRFTNIILIALIIAFVGVAVYFLFLKKAEPVAQSPSTILTSTISNVQISSSLQERDENLVLQEWREPPPLPNIATWKTYRNESCGFEIKYPSEYYEWQTSGNCANFNATASNSEVQFLHIVSRPECKFPFRDIPGCQLHTVSVADGKIRAEGISIRKENIVFGDLPAEKITVLGGVDPTLGEIIIQAQQDVGIWYRYYFAFHVKDREYAEKVLAAVIPTVKIFKKLPSTYNFFDGGSFIFEIPRYWSSQVTQEGIKKTIKFMDKDNLVFIVSVMPNNGNLTLDEWWQEQSRTSPYQKAGERMIGGVKAYQLILPETDAGPRYIFVKGNAANSVGLIYDIQANNIGAEMINRILYTFAFK
jgi:hypothetical protein